jgi:hypothetical protein
MVVSDVDGNVDSLEHMVYIFADSVSERKQKTLGLRNILRGDVNTTC